MTREQAKENLKTFGIEDPTEEQITNYLNQVNGESKRERDRADQYKEDAKKVKDLQAKLSEMQNANLSDIEKANKATEEANVKIAELEKKIARAETIKSLAEKGITGEDAEHLIREDGSIDFDTLGKIISAKESAAATAKEQEIAKNSTNPGGGTDDTNHDDKADDVINAESISFGNTASNDAKDYYKL